MRRQVITAAVLGLALATTSLPALAGGGDLNGSVDTDGPVTMCVLRWITITPPVVRVGVPRQGAIMGAKPTVMVKVRLLMGVLAPMPKPN